MFDAFGRIAKEDGVGGLWRGATPTVIRAVVLNLAMLASYDEAKEKVLDYLGTKQETLEVRIMYLSYHVVPAWFPASFRRSAVCPSITPRPNCRRWKSFLMEPFPIVTSSILWARQSQERDSRNYGWGTLLSTCVLLLTSASLSSFRTSSPTRSRSTGVKTDFFVD